MRKTNNCMRVAAILTIAAYFVYCVACLSQAAPIREAGKSSVNKVGPGANLI